MNSDLTQTRNVVNTDNPQGSAAPTGASASEDFQQAAGPEVLNQNRSLTVADNGRPIVLSRSNSGADAGTYAIIIVGTIIFLMVCRRLYAWVQSTPEAALKDKSVAMGSKKPKTVESKKPVTKKKPKKQSRAKRHQSK